MSTQIAKPIDNSIYLKLPYVSGLKCLECGRSYTLTDLKNDNGTINLFVDEFCFGPLDIEINIDEVRKTLTPEEVERRYNKGATFTMLEELLPVDNVLIEDMPFTPLKRAKNIEAKIKDLYGQDIQVYLKIESTRTDSFKYRPTIMAFNRALEDNAINIIEPKNIGFEYCSTASTLNLADTVNQLAKQYNFGSLLFVPKSIGDYKINKVNRNSTEPLEELTYEQVSDRGKKKPLIEKYANELINDIEAGIKRRKVVVYGDNYDAANNFSLAVIDTANTIAMKKWGRNVVFGPNSTMRPPYKEGSKTIGHEIALDLKHKYNLPEDKHVYFIAPGGSGAMGCSATKGVISELRELDIFKNQFSLVIAQSEKVMPIVRAYSMYLAGVPREDAEILPGYYEKDSNKLIPWDTAGTLAQSIAIAKPGSGDQALDLIIETGGSAIAVKERQIVEGLLDLKELEGVSSQDVGGVTLSALYNGVKNGTFKSGDVVVVGITGVGLDVMENKLKEFAKGTDLEERVSDLF